MREGPLCIAGKRVNSRDRGYRQRSIDVRKLLGTSFEVLLYDPACQPGRLDLEQHEITNASVEAIGDRNNLTGVRAVDELLAREISRPVLAARLRVLPFAARRDVEEPHEVSAAA